MTQKDIELWTFLNERKCHNQKATNKEFAIALNIHISTLSRIAHYKTIPSVSLAMLIQKLSENKVVWWKLIEKCKLKE